MASRAVLNQEKQKTLADLTKICKAILIDSYTSNKKELPEHINESVIEIRSSESSKIKDYFAFQQSSSKSFMHTSSLETLTLTGKQLKLLTKFIERVGFSTKKLLPNGKVFVMDRSPTEEEKHWANTVFKEENIDADHGSQTIQVRFNAAITMEFTKNCNSPVEEYRQQVVDGVTQLKDYNSGAGITKDRMDRSSIAHSIDYLGCVEVLDTTISDSKHIGHYYIKNTNKSTWIKV